MPFEPYNPTEDEGFIPYNPKQTKEEGFIPYEPESLAARGLKEFINLVPETIKETVYGLGGGKLLTFAAAYKLNKTLKERGITPPPIKELRQRLKQGMFGKMGETVPEFEIAPATTVGEKIVDVAAGIAKFTTKLALLRKAFPGVSDKALWEMENLSSGGTPGMGALTHSVFALPGKFFPGKTAAGKVGQLVAEVGVVGGFSALQQKITTGEIDWKDVAISAGIPIGLKVPGLAKKGMSKLIGRATIEGKVSPEVATKAVKDILDKSKETGLPVDYIVGNIETYREASRVVSRFPQKIKDQASFESLGNDIAKQLGMGDWKIKWTLTDKPTYSNDLGHGVATGPKQGEIDLVKPTGKLFGKAGTGGLQLSLSQASSPKYPAGGALRHTQAWVKRSMVHELGHLKNPPPGWEPGMPYKKANEGWEKWHSPEFASWVDDKVYQLFKVQPGKVLPKSETKVLSRAKEIISRPSKPITQIKDFTDFKPSPNNQTPITGKDGGPITVYHGTVSEFEYFKKSKLGTHTGAKSAKMGFFFASDPTTSKGYLKTDYAKPKVVTEVALNTAKKTMEVFEGLTSKAGKANYEYWKNVYEGMKKQSLTQKEIPILLSSKTNFELEGNIKSANLIINNPKMVTMKGRTRVASYAKIISDAKKAGHDGVIITNTLDGGGLDTIWVVFSPKQIVNKGSLSVADFDKSMKEGLLPKTEVQKNVPVSPVEGKTPVKGMVDIDSVNQRLLETTTTAKALNATEVAAANKVLRKRQAWRGTKATLAGMRAGRGLGESISAGRRAYGGKAKVPEITPPDLTPEQWNTYYKKILEIYPPQGRLGVKTQFQRTGTKDALDKLKAGVIPTNYDFGLLDKVLGRETTLQLHKNMAQHRKFGLWDIPVLTRDGLKSMFGYDPQVVRQGRGTALRHPLIYGKAIKANIQAYKSQVQANRINAALEASPGWELSKKQGINYLGTTPWASVKAGTKLQQYGMFTDFLLSRKNKYLKAWGQLLSASERGADTGMNVELKGLWDVGQADLAAYQVRHPMTPLQIEKWSSVRVHDINAVMKRVVAKNPKAREIQKAANWVLFSSAHTISRPISTWRSIKNLAVGKGFSGRTYAAQLTVSNIASLSALSAIGAYIGHKARVNDPTKEPKFDSSNDPTDSMWGKYRIGNDVIDLSGGDVGTYRLLARIGVSAYMYGKGAVTGKEYTYRPPGEELKRYIQSRETVLLGLAKTLATGTDWLGQPIGRREALLKQFPMEFLVSVVEAGNADGMWEALQGGDVSKASKEFVKNIPVGMAGIAGLGTASYKVSTASTRFDFQDNIAKKKYNKKWEDLNPIQQKVLKIQNRKQFDVFERKVAEENIEDPRDNTRIIEAQRKAGIRMRSKLDKVNRSKVKGIKLGISRSPEKFRLNDERYNRYQELIATYLNKFLSKVTIKGTERSKADRVRIGLFIELSKRRALIDLKREMR